MRRSLFVLFLSVICLVLTPAPAGAWFWRWIDDLSGPQFQGFVLEAKVYCFGQTNGARMDMLRGVKQRLEAERVLYRRLADVGSVREEYYNIVAFAITTEAIREVEPLLQSGEVSASTANRVLRNVASYRLYARVTSDARIPSDAKRVLFDKINHWLKHVEAGYDTYASAKVAFEAQVQQATQGPASGAQTPQDPRPQIAAGLVATGKAASFRLNDNEVTASAAMLPVLSGGRISLCKFDYLDENEFFFSANVGYGWEVKPENRGRGLKLATFGSSAHWTIVPAVTVGAGVGMARFFVRSPARNFSTLYVDAPIIEIKPLTLLAGNPRFRGPLSHSIYVRYTGTIFPAGFEANQFYPGSQAYQEAEYINSVGLFFDAEPFLRGRRGKWWKDRP